MFKWICIAHCQSTNFLESTTLKRSSHIYITFELIWKWIDMTFAFNFRRFIINIRTNFLKSLSDETTLKFSIRWENNCNAFLNGTSSERTHPIYLSVYNEQKRIKMKGGVCMFWRSNRIYTYCVNYIWRWAKNFTYNDNQRRQTFEAFIKKIKTIIKSIYINVQFSQIWRCTTCWW
jgi:hypothetical protein